MFFYVTQELSVFILILAHKEEVTPFFCLSFQDDILVEQAKFQGHVHL